MTPPSLIEVLPRDDGKGTLAVNLHAGQLRAWESDRRFLLVLAGIQSGKTEFGPLWLWREIQRRGPGDYGVISPSFALANKKVLPAFRTLFEKVLRLGRYTGSPAPVFRFSKKGLSNTFNIHKDRRTSIGLDGVTVHFGHAENPDSLESATYKAVWADEAGQSRFKLQSWEALQRRLSINQGRALLTTAPYSFNWLYENLYKPWHALDAEGRRHPHIDVIRFTSLDNPVFPREEWERARAELPAWKFDLNYRAIFTRPAGLIYGDFADQDVIEPFPIPDHWPRHLGLDFGGANTAAIYYAEDPATRQLYAYREYRGGHRTAAEHAALLKSGEPEGFPATCCGGAKSEGQWRDEFRAAGVPVVGPDITDVELGITRCIGAYRGHRVKVFNTCSHYLDELRGYSRVVDDKGQVTTEIEAKDTFHILDASRYILSKLLSVRQPFVVVSKPQEAAAPPQKRDTSWDRLGVLRPPSGRVGVKP